MFYTLLPYIEGLVVAICGTGWFLNWRAAHRKPELENKSIEIANDHESVNTATDAASAARAMMSDLREDREYLRDQVLELTQRNRTLRDEIDVMNTEKAISRMIVCRNISCPFRCPEYGNGPKWFEESINQENIYNDNPIEDIAAEKGYSIKRIKRLPE